MKTFWRDILAQVRPTDRAFPDGCFDSLSSGFVRRSSPSQSRDGGRIVRSWQPSAWDACRESNYTPLPSALKVIVVFLSIGPDGHITPAVPKIQSGNEPNSWPK